MRKIATLTVAVALLALGISLLNPINGQAVTPALYDRMAPSLTIYSGLRAPHLATAPPALRDFLSAVSDAAFGREVTTEIVVQESEPLPPRQTLLEGQSRGRSDRFLHGFLLDRS